MNFLNYCKEILSEVEKLEGKITENNRFSMREFKEILEISKTENRTFLKDVMAIKSLSFFDVSFLMSNVALTKQKIDTIKTAIGLWDANSFKAQGQTLSDFIFRVCANLDIVNSDNLDVFKELAKCKNDVYDFKNLMRNPQKYIKNEAKAPKFEFVTVFY